MSIGRVHLGPLTHLDSVASAAATRLRRRLERADIEDHQRGVGLVAVWEVAQKRVQTIHQRLKATGPQPALHPVFDRSPRRRIVCPCPSLRAT